MTHQSCLSDPDALLVADASVIINLNASGYAVEILGALPNRIAMSKIASNELLDRPTDPRKDGTLLKSLVDQGLVSIIERFEDIEDVFTNLVVGPAQETLDDGEAATIACGVIFGMVPILDEKKANSLCARNFETLPRASTIDIFSHPAVAQGLGEERLISAVYNSLMQARMRVLPHHLEWVIQTIGEERAVLCKSLPRSAKAI